MAEIIKEEQLGSTLSGRETLDETLRKMFDAYDMVGVKNITSLELSIPYLPSKNEKIVTNNITKRVYGRQELSDDGLTITPGKRETLRIGPGEVATIAGEFAYVAIPFIINIQLQLDERKKNNSKGDTELNTRVVVEREIRRHELLKEVYLGFPKSSNKPE